MNNLLLWIKNIFGKISYQPPTCIELLEVYESQNLPRTGEKLRFKGAEGHDVYNVSVPFSIGNKIVISGRVESRVGTTDSQIFFFENNNNEWVKIESAPVFKLEDGFVTQMDGEIIFGGVEIYKSPTALDPNNTEYRTVFYRGHDLTSLQKFTEGPNSMKDVRLLKLKSGKIAVFTRPTGGEYGNGKIGYTEIDKLEELNSDTVLRAKIIENQFAPNEWGGANNLHELDDGMIGVVGHVAYLDANISKHYYSAIFIYGPKTHKASPIKIIAKRGDFPSGNSKTPQLEDVIFTGGLVRHSNGTASIYVGLGDAEAGVITIPDPFLDHAI